MGWDADQQAAAPPAGRDDSGQATSSPVTGEAPAGSGDRWAHSGRRAALMARTRRLARAILDSDEAAVEEAVLRLSRSRRLFAPLALAAGAVIMLFDGLRLVFANWRLTLIQLLPAMWIWAAMYDLKAHVLYGKTYHLVTGPARAAIVLAVTVITAASFFLNAVFAFAIAKPGPPQIRPAFREARSHLAIVLGSGAVVGLCLGLSTVVLIHWGLWWFALALSIVIGVMMISYVAIPSRLIGIKASRSGYSKRDKLTATAVGGVIGAVVCTPPYLLGRIGLLMLGVRALLIPGIVVFLTGLTLQAGTTSAVKAVKLGAKLVSGRGPAAGDRPLAGGAPPATAADGAAARDGG
jgi:hypothetical protein